MPGGRVPSGHGSATGGARATAPDAADGIGATVDPADVAVGPGRTGPLVWGGSPVDARGLGHAAGGGGVARGGLWPGTGQLRVDDGGVVAGRGGLGVQRQRRGERAGLRKVLQRGLRSGPGWAIGGNVSEAPAGDLWRVRPAGGRVAVPEAPDTHWGWVFGRRGSGVLRPGGRVGRAGDLLRGRLPARRARTRAAGDGFPAGVDQRRLVWAGGGAVATPGERRVPRRGKWRGLGAVHQQRRDRLGGRHRVVREQLGERGDSVHAEGFVVVRVPVGLGDAGRTVYARHGDVLGWGCAAAACWMVIRARLARKVEA